MPDDRWPGFRKFPVAGCRSRRRTKQSLLLIKTHGFWIDLGALRELPSCETFQGFSVNPVGVYRGKGIRDSDRRCIRTRGGHPVQFGYWKSALPKISNNKRSCDNYGPSMRESRLRRFRLVVVPSATLVLRCLSSTS
jgi:hypothetical protein